MVQLEIGQAPQSHSGTGTLRTSGSYRSEGVRTHDIYLGSGDTWLGQSKTINLNFTRVKRSVSAVSLCVSLLNMSFYVVYDVLCVLHGLWAVHTAHHKVAPPQVPGAARHKTAHNNYVKRWSLFQIPDTSELMKKEFVLVFVHGWLLERFCHIHVAWVNNGLVLYSASFTLASSVSSRRRQTVVFMHVLMVSCDKSPLIVHRVIKDRLSVVLFCTRYHTYICTDDVA